MPSVLLKFSRRVIYVFNFRNFLSDIVFDIYLTAKQYKKSFYAFCSEKVITIDAIEDLYNVEVLNNQTQVVCNFDKILAGSKEICIVNVTGFYIVKVGDRKDIVYC